MLPFGNYYYLLWQVMKSLFLAIIWSSCYALIVSFAMSSENKLGNAISSGIVKIQSSEVAFASELEKNSIKPKEISSKLKVDKSPRAKKSANPTSMFSSEPKNIWKALEYVHANVPSHCHEAKKVLGLVIKNAKKRNSVNKALAKQWVGYIRKTHCIHMNKAETMFG